MSGEPLFRVAGFTTLAGELVGDAEGGVEFGAEVGEVVGVAKVGGDVGAAVGKSDGGKVGESVGDVVGEVGAELGGAVGAVGGGGPSPPWRALEQTLSLLICWPVRPMPLRADRSSFWVRQQKNGFISPVVMSRPSPCHHGNRRGPSC